MMEPSTLSPVLHVVRRPVWIATAITVISCAVVLVQLHRIRHLRAIHHHHHPRIVVLPRAYAPACSGSLRVKSMAAARLAPPTLPAAADDTDAATSEPAAASPLASLGDPHASWRTLGIARISDQAYAIDHELVEAVLKAPLTAMRGERIVPTSRHGQPYGFKLFHLMPNSALTALGLHDGDTLIAFDGVHLVDRDAERILFHLGAPGHVLTYETAGGRRVERTIEIR
ncbi:MAG TPA: hypothetical protein VFP84_14970 [Kofleriaceae bacterium]|nr:hypothetical protein [Kofleriaceae bacterium]